MPSECGSLVEDEIQFLGEELDVNTVDDGRCPSDPGSRPSDGAASVSTVPASIPNAPWWAGDNDEFFNVGPCQTRDEALGEAWSYFGDHEPIYLVQARLAAWSPPKADSIIDMMVDNSDELFPEDGFDGMAGTKEAIAEAEADLDRLLVEWLGRWRSIFPEPRAFGWLGKLEVVSASGIEAATAGETPQSGSTEGESPVGESRDAQGQAS